MKLIFTKKGKYPGKMGGKPLNEGDELDLPKRYETLPWFVKPKEYKTPEEPTKTIEIENKATLSLVSDVSEITDNMDPVKLVEALTLSTKKEDE